MSANPPDRQAIRERDRSRETRHDCQDMQREEPVFYTETERADYLKARLVAAETEKTELREALEPLLRLILEDMDAATARDLACDGPVGNEEGEVWRQILEAAIQARVALAGSGSPGKEEPCDCTVRPDLGFRLRNPDCPEHGDEPKSSPGVLLTPEQAQQVERALRNLPHVRGCGLYHVGYCTCGRDDALAVLGGHTTEPVSAEEEAGPTT